MDHPTLVEVLIPNPAASSANISPIVESTFIRLAVDRLPGNRSPEPLWLWSSAAGTSAEQADRA